MSNTNSFQQGKQFVADLADALNVSFKAVESHSEVGTFRRTKPRITQDYLLFGEMGCFEGGATLARVRLFKDAKFDDGIILSVSQYDPEVIPHTRRLFREQHYNGIGFSYIAGPDVPNKAELLRRTTQEAA